MNEHIQYLLTGLFFGLIAGISPGPLLTLVITETIKHSKTQGIKVAIAPLITDLPIIIVTIFILSKLSNFEFTLAVISFLGAAFILYLGYECIKTKGIEINLKNITPQSLKKGIVANILNPHPYFFWLTVGAPIIFKSYREDLSFTIIFITSFYIILIGSKIIISLLVDKTRYFLEGKFYIWAMRILGISLFVFVIIFVKEGIKYLNA